MLLPRKPDPKCKGCKFEEPDGMCGKPMLAEDKLINVILSILRRKNVCFEK